MTANYAGQGRHWLAHQWVTGLDKRVQYVWGLRYIDDCLMHRADLNNDGDYTDSNENTWYHMTDGMFSTVAVLSRAATLVERVSYDSYGQARHHRPGDVNGDGNSGFTDSALVGTIIVANGGTPVPITSSLYRAEADLNRDGTINSSDRTLAGVSASALAAALISNAGTGGPDNSIGWDGYVFNPATGDYLVRHRTYIPTLGRWGERDPAGYVDGASLYQYVGSRPSNGLDATGLAEILGRACPGSRHAPSETQIRECCQDAFAGGNQSAYGKTRCCHRGVVYCINVSNITATAGERWSPAFRIVYSCVASCEPTHCVNILGCLDGAPIWRHGSSRECSEAELAKCALACLDARCGGDASNCKACSGEPFGRCGLCKINIAELRRLLQEFEAANTAKCVAQRPPPAPSMGVNRQYSGSVPLCHKH
ncbi:MAG: hypothetical protein KF724_13590 [Phycisphaeraceae bacterium]|nr:hypothetical protein [Phycisphaeraceae bacterium]